MKQKKTAAARVDISTLDPSETQNACAPSEIHAISGSPEDSNRRRRFQHSSSSSGESINTDESMDRPGAYPIRVGTGRIGMGSVQGTILYSMGTNNGFPNDEQAGAIDVSDVEQNTDLPIAAELAQDMEQEIALRLEEERRQQPVAQAIEMKGRICGKSRGCIIGVVLFVSIVFGLVVGISVFYARREETVVPTDIPTDPPTESRYNTILNLIGSIVTNDDSIFQNTNSYEYAAMDWLGNNDTWWPSVDSYGIQAWVERYALAFFYFTTNGQAWARGSNFLNAFNTSSVCEWHWAIECEKMLVVHIYLYEGGPPSEDGSEDYPEERAVKGRIPTELALLTSLRDLDLEMNQLSGPLPSEIGLMTSLKYLALYENDLTGTIPTEIGAVTSLEGLYLSYNQMTGPIPTEMGLLTNLRGLHMSNNLLTGSVPTELSNLNKLRRAHFDGNSITGSLDDILCDFPELSEVIADCLGEDPEVICSCCTWCCHDSSTDSDGSECEVIGSFGI